MQGMFEMQFIACWSNVDPNWHMANTAYFEFAVNTRIAFFASKGFTPADFQRHGFGPVIRNDFAEYSREIGLNESFTVTMENGGLSDDGSRFRVVNSFYKEGHVLSARVGSIGGWLSYKERKLIAPPTEVIEAHSSLPRSEDFEELRSSIKR